MANQNPYADMMKAFTNFQAPSMPAMPNFDMSNVLNSGRRNAEAASAAGQAVAESCQAIARRQAELSRAHVEKCLKTTKDMLVNGSPEINTTKQVELAKTMFESSLNNIREVYELLSKSGFETFDVINKRASEIVDELSGSLQNAATSSKKKAA